MIVTGARSFERTSPVSRYWLAHCEGFGVRCGSEFGFHGFDMRDRGLRGLSFMHGRSGQEAVTQGCIKVRRAFPQRM